jgi:hypothetical protein
MLHTDNKYIYINENSLSSYICKDLITMYEKHENKFDGRVMSGMNKNIKDTTDFEIPNNDKIWYKYHNLLRDELGRNLKKYITLINTSDKDYNNPNLNSPYTFSHLRFETMKVHVFLFQKYDKQKGRYIYHNDSRINVKDNEYRIITFLWYINDVTEGGETCFGDNIQIKPQRGKLILFPSCWTFPHCGKVPLSSDKYIITGWVYLDIDFI